MAEIPAAALTRLPPQALDAEAALLGAMLIRAVACETLLEEMQPGDFYAEQHRTIFSAIAAVRRRGQTADLLTVSQILTEKNVMARVGGLAYINRLVEECPAHSHAADYLKIVQEHALRRRLLDAAATIERLARGELPAGEAAQQSEAALYAAAHTREKADFHDLFGLVSDRLDHYLEGSEKPSRIALGIPSLNVIMNGGLRYDEMALWAGRPGMCKTAYMLWEAVGLATRGTPVAVFSLEQSKEALRDRAVASLGRIDVSSLEHGRLKYAEGVFQSLAKAHAGSDIPLWIYDRSGCTLSEVISLARRARRQHGVQFFFLDHVQRLKVEPPYRITDTAFWSHVARRLKDLVRETGGGLVVLSQLNREVEKRPDKRPRLSDLRESGALEEEADTVMMFYREAYYQQQAGEMPSWPHPVDLMVEKGRQHATGIAKAWFWGPHMAFEDPDAVPLSEPPPDQGRQWRDPYAE